MDSAANKIPKSQKEIISKLNFSKFKREIITEINRARSYPNTYLQKIEEILATQDPKEKKNSIITINGVQVRLIEGREVLESASEFLKTQKNVKKIKLLGAMDAAANELLEHLIAQEGLIDSEQILEKDIYDPETRLNKQGKCFGAVDEIIDCGCFDAELLVISLILGDGDENRLERNTLFLEEFKFAGIAAGVLPKSERICTVINICEEFVSPGEYIPKSQKRVKFSGDYDHYEGAETVNNKLYLSKKFYEKTEIIDETSDDNNRNKNTCKSKDKEETQYSETSHSTKYSTEADEKWNNKNTRSNFQNVKADGRHNRKKSSLLTFRGKKNSINKFISFFNDQERYLNTIFEKMGKEFENEDCNSDSEDDCYEYYETREETTTKKVISRRNKNSIVSFYEIEELEREKNDMDLPYDVYRITWNETKFTDPLDKKAYFVVEKNTYKNDGEVIRVVYTKY